MGMSTDALLILAATTIQQNAVCAQTHNDPYYSVYYWFSPGRIAGIAVGVALLLLLLLSLLIMACRRRKRARAASTAPNVAVPAYPPEDVQPRPYPSWQQSQVPSYGPHVDPRWYHSTPGTAPAPYGQPKTATPPRDARGTEPPQHPASLSDGQRVAPSYPWPKPAPTSHAQRPASPGQVQRPASTSRVSSTVPPGQAQVGALPSPEQSVAPSDGAPSTSPLDRAQEQVRLPRPAYTRATQSASGMNGREASPPPYSPPPRPLELSAMHAAR